MKNFFILLLFLLSLCASAQKEIKVILKDSETDLPIEEATITVLTTNQGLLSNKEGLFILYLKRPSLIEITHSSYKRKSVRSNLLKEEVNVIYLETNTQQLDEVILTREEPQVILRNVIKNSIKELTIPANLKVYTREFFKKDGKHIFYNDGLLNFQILSANKKITNDILVEQNRCVGVAVDFDKDLVGYNLNNLMENYYNFSYLNEIAETKALKKYNFQIRNHPNNGDYYIIYVKPLATYDGAISEYSIVYDIKKKLIIETSSYLPHDRTGGKNQLFDLGKKVIHSKYRTVYRLDNNDYYLANSTEEIGFIITHKNKDIKIEVKNYFITTDFRTKVFKYEPTETFKEKTLLNIPDKIMTNYWDFDSGMILTDEEKDIINLIKK